MTCVISTLTSAERSLSLAHAHKLNPRINCVCVYVGELHEICTCPVRYIFDKELVIVSEIKRRKSFVQVIICYKMGLISLNYQPSTNRPHI